MTPLSPFKALEAKWRKALPMGSQIDFCYGYDSARRDCADELSAVRETVEQEMADLRAQLASLEHEHNSDIIQLVREKAAAEAEVERLRSFVSELAGMQTCDDDKAHCELDSGPYCGRHDVFIEDWVIEARKLLGPPR